MKRSNVGGRVAAIVGALALVLAFTAPVVEAQNAPEDGCAEIARAETPLRFAYLDQETFATDEFVATQEEVRLDFTARHGGRSAVEIRNEDGELVFERPVFQSRDTGQIVGLPTPGNYTLKVTSKDNLATATVSECVADASGDGEGVYAEPEASGVTRTISATQTDSTRFYSVQTPDATSVRVAYDTSGGGALFIYPGRDTVETVNAGQRGYFDAQVDSDTTRLEVVASGEVTYELEVSSDELVGEDDNGFPPDPGFCDFQLSGGGGTIFEFKKESIDSEFVATFERNRASLDPAYIYISDAKTGRVLDEVAVDADTEGRYTFTPRELGLEAGREYLFVTTSPDGGSFYSKFAVPCDEPEEPPVNPPNPEPNPPTNPPPKAVKQCLAQPEVRKLIGQTRVNAILSGREGVQENRKGDSQGRVYFFRSGVQSDFSAGAGNDVVVTLGGRVQGSTDGGGDNDALCSFGSQNNLRGGSGRDVVITKGVQNTVDLRDGRGGDIARSLTPPFIGGGNEAYADRGDLTKNFGD